MRLYYVLYYGQAQAGATYGTRTAAVGTVE